MMQEFVFLLAHFIFHKGAQLYYSRAATENVLLQMLVFLSKHKSFPPLKISHIQYYGHLWDQQ